MQTLLLVSLYEFKLFLQIVLWIAIPLTVVAILITTMLHYRRKKKMRDAGGLVAEPVHAMISPEPGPLPDWLASSNPDNASLLKKYEREIRRYREDYANLEQDFRKLEEKYTDLLNKAYHNEGAGDNGMAHLHQEIKDYKLKIVQLQQALEYSEHNQLQALDGADRALQEALSRLREENAVLKEKLADYEMVQDLLQEQKLQTDFLQQQLEQRIKGYHQLEKQAGESTAQAQQLRLAVEAFQKQEAAWLQEREEKQTAMMQLETQVAESNSEVQQLQLAVAAHQEKESAWLHEMEEKQAAIERLKTEAGETGGVMQEKSALVEKLEAELHSLRQQEAAFESEREDNQDIIRTLESNIVLEQQKVQELQNRLEQSTQLFKRIYAELSGSIYVHPTTEATLPLDTDLNEPARPSLTVHAEPVESAVAAQ